MKKFATLVVAATLAAAPVVAQDANVNGDPFVSSAGPAIGLTPGLIAAGVAITVIGLAAVESSDDT